MARLNVVVSDLVALTLNANAVPESQNGVVANHVVIAVTNPPFVVVVARPIAQMVAFNICMACINAIGLPRCLNRVVRDGVSWSSIAVALNPVRDAITTARVIFNSDVVVLDG